MSSFVHSINTTMDLSECTGNWTLDKEHGCWRLEDILYTPVPSDPVHQRLSIFVPSEYLADGGRINAGGARNGYTAFTAPVLFRNNSAGYMYREHLRLEDPECDALQFLDAGYVYVTSGNRGYQSVDEAGRYIGKSPANLIDLKTVIRFLRHNRNHLPGDYDRIITCGVSAGGAMSALLGVTGDHPDYEELLRENGAFPDESDAVFASQIYCPITDLEHADAAYEWCFHADKENEASHAGAAGVMDPFREALSADLMRQYAVYFNSLDLKDPKTGEDLVFHPDGRSGSAYDYVMKLLGRSAGKFLKKLRRDAGESAVDKYLSELSPGEPGESGAEKEHKDSCFLTWDGNEAQIRDLDAYVLSHRRRMKPCTSFDVLPMNSGENRLFGGCGVYAAHFSRQTASALEAVKDRFPEEYKAYYEKYAADAEDSLIQRQLQLIDPMHYIKGNAEEKLARHFRIRVGAQDADTSFSISMTLALSLAAAGRDTDYELVWDKPHCDADYPGELISWIDSIMQCE